MASSCLLALPLSLPLPITGLCVYKVLCVCVQREGTTLPNKRKIGFSRGVGERRGVEKKKKHQELCAESGVWESKQVRVWESLLPSVFTHCCLHVCVCVRSLSLCLLALSPSPWHTLGRAHTLRARGREGVWGERTHRSRDAAGGFPRYVLSYACLPERQTDRIRGREAVFSCFPACFSCCCDGVCCAGLYYNVCAWGVLVGVRFYALRVCGRFCCVFVPTLGLSVLLRVCQ